MSQLGLKGLSNEDIYKFIQGTWDKYAIPSLTKPEYVNFIQRNKFLITEELFEDTKQFDNAISREYRKYENGNDIFQLQIRSIRKTQCLIKYKQHSSNHRYLYKLMGKFKGRMTFICKCSFQLNKPNIIDIVKSNKCMLQCEYLKFQKDENNEDYIVVNIINDYDEYQHLNNCEWLKTMDYALILYQWQMIHCNLFIQNCLNYNNNDKMEDEWEEDIDLDFKSNSNRDLEIKQYPHLSCIQSIILYKSIKAYQDKLYGINKLYDQHRNTMIELMDKYNKDRINWKWNRPNQSQLEAIIKSILSPFSLIQGPPGTGKTSTCAQLINIILLLQHYTNNIIEKGKIFVCAYTHNAANELLDKISYLCPNNIDNISRIGDTERIWPKKLKQFSFEMRVNEYMKNEGKKKEEGIKYIFEESLVIIGTVYSAHSLRKYMDDKKDVFNYLIIDECTQILDPIINIAVNILDHSSNNSHVILIGDHKQLPPVIKSDKVQKDDRKITLFETLVNIKENKSNFYTLLNVQYRMPMILMAFSNQQFYENKIKSYQQYVNRNVPAIQEIFHLISARIEWLNNVNVYYSNNIPIFVINIKNGQEKRNQENGSWENEQEAQFIGYLLGLLPKYKTLLASTGVISLYKQQSNCIRQQIRYKKELQDILISTVDAFQGKEKELIILSLVRDVMTNPNIFNCDHKRINVALTRCKNALIVVTSFDHRKVARQSNNHCYMNIWKTWFTHFRSLPN